MAHARKPNGKPRPNGKPKAGPKPNWPSPKRPPKTAAERAWWERESRRAEFVLWWVSMSAQWDVLWSFVSDLREELRDGDSPFATMFDGPESLEQMKLEISDLACLWQSSTPRFNAPPDFPTLAAFRRRMTGQT